MGRYQDLSREDLIRLQELSVNALRVSNQSELDAYIRLFSETFPIEQFAVVSFCREGSRFRILALHNRGFPTELEQDFLENDRIANCKVLLKHCQCSGHSSSMVSGDNEVLVGIESAHIRRGYYGIIRPSRNLVGVICMLNKPDSESDAHWLSLLESWLPHIQLAQSRALEASCLPDIELTPREYDVLRWLCRGKTNWEMSRILAISESTVKFHVANLIQKLGASNRAHAVALAGPVLASRRYRLSMPSH